MVRNAVSEKALAGFKGFYTSSPARTQRLSPSMLRCHAKKALSTAASCRESEFGGILVMIPPEVPKPMIDETVIAFEHQESLPYWLIVTAHAIERVLNAELAPLGMTFRQAEILGLLAMEGALSQAQVAERIGVEAPTLAGIVARMETAGWIEREPCPRDRRKKLLRPTRRVEPIWAQILERGLLVRGRLTQGFSPDEVRDLIGRLECMLRNLDDHSTARPSEPASQ